MRVNVITLELPLFKCRQAVSVRIDRRWLVPKTADVGKEEMKNRDTTPFSPFETEVELYTLRTNVRADINFLSFLVCNLVR